MMIAVPPPTAVVEIPVTATIGRDEGRRGHLPRSNRYRGGPGQRGTTEPENKRPGKCDGPTDEADGVPSSDQHADLPNPSN
jgi:hypothetical protein